MTAKEQLQQLVAGFGEEQSSRALGLLGPLVGELPGHRGSRLLPASGDNYAFQLAGLVDSDLRRMAELVRRYADRHLGGTDASVIAVCERLAIATVATVNLRDFANVRPRHVAALTTVP